MDQLTSFTIVADCYDQIALTQLVESVSLPEPSQVRIKETDNLTFLADSTVVASIVAGGSLIISQLVGVLLRELLARHQRNCKHKATEKDNDATDMASQNDPDEIERVPAIVVTHSSGPSETIVRFEKIPSAATIDRRGISEIRLVLLDRSWVR